MVLRLVDSTDSPLLSWHLTDCQVAELRTGRQGTIYKTISWCITVWYGMALVYHPIYRIVWCNIYIIVWYGMLWYIITVADTHATIQAL